MVENWKAKAIVRKWRKARRGICLSSKEDYESNIRDNMDLDQANEENPLLL